MLGSLWQLARSWWRVDRIRVSPREGRLLRLEPPCILLVEGRPAEVLARRTGQGAAGPYVVYDCRSAAGPCRLHVTPLGVTHSVDVRWSAAGDERAIALDDIEVYSPTDIVTPPAPASGG